MFVFVAAVLNRPNASLVLPDFCFTPYPIWRPIWHQRTNATFARKVCLDFKSIHAFNPLFAHLAVLSFEVVLFYWKLSLTRLLRLISLAHRTTKLLFLLA